MIPDLLKLAEKKQHEPIVIEQKKTNEERPLTKKQKKEQEKVKEWIERKNGRAEQSVVLNKIPKLNGHSVNQKIPKQSDRQSVGDRIDVKKTNPKDTCAVSDNKAAMAKNNNNIRSKQEIAVEKQDKGVRKEMSGSQLGKSVDRQQTYSKNEMQKVRRNDVTSEKLKTTKDAENGINVKSTVLSLNTKSQNGLHRGEKIMQRDNCQAKKPSVNNVKSKPLISKTSPLPAAKSREFPPKDVKRKPLPVNKRRILDDDEEDYDSEMDDFIDDGPEEEPDYSKYITEIFGYDKKKFQHDDDDLDNMESTFAQQMKEEVISTKIGIMEDLEDMKKEEEAKRRKAELFKKLKKR